MSDTFKSIGHLFITPKYLHRLSRPAKGFVVFDVPNEEFGGCGGVEEGIGNIESQNKNLNML